MFTVGVRRHMMIAHSLSDPYFGPASALHGATYVVDVEFSAEQLNAKAVVIDIGAAGDGLSPAHTSTRGESTPDRPLAAPQTAGQV